MSTGPENPGDHENVMDFCLSGMSLGIYHFFFVLDNVLVSVTLYDILFNVIPGTREK